MLYNQVETITTQGKAITDEKAYWVEYFRSKARETEERVNTWYQCDKK